MIIKYGLINDNIDVTSICYDKLKNDDYIIIPSTDEVRIIHFSDPCPNKLKSIFIINNDTTTEYDHTQTIYIDNKLNKVLTDVSDDIRLLNPDEKLLNIQNKLQLKYGSFDEELPEQKMVTRYLTGNEKVLEIGGNIGRNSLIISYILNQNNNINHVVLECNVNIAKQLKENKELNNAQFYIENSALSKRKLIQKNWNTIVSDVIINGYTNVNTITYDEFIQKYNIQFDTLVLDCEGAFYYILMDMPEILNNINLIIMENDYRDINKKNYIDTILKKNNFYVDYSEAGGWGPCCGNFFEVWKKSSITEYIEKVVYINLEHRTDRKELIEKELSIFSSKKVVRFNAIKEDNGHIGASKSHIEVLKLAIKNNWENVLVVEDDATWHNLENGYPIFEKLIKENYDVILFGFGECNYIINENYKLSKAISATAYLIKNHYYATLLQNFEESLEKLIVNPSWYNCIDQGWHKLMASDNWYGIYPVILYQRDGYSDIEKRFREVSGIIKPKQKVLAYYFPQYHSFPENDFIFGDNFTDWDLYKNKETNELLSFKQPIQPPNGLGYYDPTLIDVRKEQAALAKKYNVDGFIYYHYWIENHPVMNKVIDNMLEDNEPNIPFCICFANESWKHNYGITQTFKSVYPDGSTYRQLYDNPIEHAEYLQKIFKHSNYIKINNLPIIFIYRHCNEVFEYLDIICKELKKYDIEDLYVISCISSRWMSQYVSLNTKRQPNAYSPFIPHYKLISSDIIVPDYLSKLPCVYGGFMGWNSMLRHPNFKKIIDYKPNEITKNICRDLLQMKYDLNSPQIYAIFAWNEWTEGAIIEPNTIYGEELGYAIKKARDIIQILENDIKFANTIFEYGLDKHFINITKNVYIKCIDINTNNKWVINIPKNDTVRPKLFGDPLPGIVKVIKVTSYGITKIYDDTIDIVIEII
jgi:FkbM family methyltransferase